MNNIVGTPRKIFKIIYNRYKKDNLINAEEIKLLFSNHIQLEEDLTYLYNLGLIDRDNDYKYHLTTKGRIYFKEETINSVEMVIKSIFCPIIVSIITTLTTLWLNNLL